MLPDGRTPGALIERGLPLHFGDRGLRPFSVRVRAQGRAYEASPDDLAAQVVRGVAERAGFGPDNVEDLIVGEESTRTVVRQAGFG